MENLILGNPTTPLSRAFIQTTSFLPDNIEEISEPIEPSLVKKRKIDTSRVSHPNQKITSNTKTETPKPKTKTKTISNTKTETSKPKPKTPNPKTKTTNPKTKATSNTKTKATKTKANTTCKTKPTSAPKQKILLEASESIPASPPSPPRSPKKELPKPTSHFLKGKVIAFDGMPLIGKTTLIQKLRTKSKEQVDTVSTDHLVKQFASLCESNEYFFPFQLASFFHQELSANQTILSPKNNCVTLWDQTILGDYCFCLGNYLQGYLSLPELQVFEKQIQAKIGSFLAAPSLAAVDVVVWLADSIGHIIARQKEPLQSLDMESLQQLDNLYFSFLLSYLAENTMQTEKLQKKVLVLRFDQFNDKSFTLKALDKLIQSTSSSPTIQLINKLPQIADLSTKMIFHNENEINEFVSSLETSPNSLSHFNEAQKVYLPNLFKLHFDFKSYESLKRDYSQNYKNLVYWCLSRGISITFFDHLEKN